MEELQIFSYNSYSVEPDEIIKNPEYELRAREISKNIRIKSFADWNQDSTLIIEILKKDIILNMNDAKARGWSRTIKKILKRKKIL